MKEASLIKFYLARYFFLGIAILQSLAATLLLTQWPDNAKNRFVVFLIATLALVFLSLHLVIANRIKRVAISKKKIAIVEYNKVKIYQWSDVKYLTFIRFLNFYCLKIKGKRGKIYFLPTRSTAPVYGMATQVENIFLKK